VFLLLPVLATDGSTLYFIQDGESSRSVTMLMSVRRMYSKVLFILKLFIQRTDHFGKVSTEIVSVLLSHTGIMNFHTVTELNH